MCVLIDLLCVTEGEAVLIYMDIGVCAQRCAGP